MIQIKEKTSSLQFLPISMEEISKEKHILYNERKLKTSYLIDITHTLILKYYFRKENKFNLSSIVLKDKYGSYYNNYINYLVEYKYIRVLQEYRKGKNARVYCISEDILKDKIIRYVNTDKTLLKKYKKMLESYGDMSESTILAEVKEKLVGDLFYVQVDYDKAMYYLTNISQPVHVFQKNKYSVESIKDNHIFYHFDTYGRMHTNFTILKSFIRKNCLHIDGEETCELDINNSQPLFLTKIMSETTRENIDENEYNLFKYLTKNGLLYQHIIDNSDIIDKNDVKKMVYKVLFGKNYKNESDDIFYKIFPTIHNFIKFYKKEHKNYRILSHNLQKSESNLIYNKIIKEVIVLIPDIKIITIHDSIVFQKRYKSVVEEIFNRKLKEEFNI